MAEFVFEKLQSIYQDWYDANEERLQRLPAPIAESWKRSATYGIDPEMNKLPPIASWERKISADSLRNITSEINTGLLNYVRSMHKLLNSANIAVLITNQSLRIFETLGDDAILQDLAQKNITPGALLSERNAGTNPLTLARQDLDIHILNSSDCYSRIFDGYKLIGQQISSDHGIMALAFIPQMLYSEARMEIVRHFFNTLVSAFAIHEQHGISYPNQVLQFVLKQSLTSYAIVDETGRILDADSSFTNQVDVFNHSIIGSKVSEIIPEITSVLHTAIKMTVPKEALSLGVHAIKGENYFIRSVCLEGTPKKNAYALLFKRISDEMFESHGSSEEESLVGNSAAIKKLQDDIATAADTHANIVITGENGTEKESIARLIHKLDKETSGPFIAVSCAAIPGEQLRESLFGANNQTASFIGAFERALGGTLFLDEIDHMPLDIQSTLARALERNTKNSRNNMAPSLRVIVASDYDLMTLLRNGTIRPDLYYLLDIVHIDSVPLRFRTSDIPNILSVLSHEYAHELNMWPILFTDEAISVMQHYPWPGNMREMRNAVMRLFYANLSAPVSPADLPTHITGCATEAHHDEMNEFVQENAPFFADAPLIDFSADTSNNEEYRLIEEALREANGNKAKAAKILGITRQTLYNRMKKCNYPI